MSLFERISDANAPSQNFIKSFDFFLVLGLQKFIKGAVAKHEPQAQKQNPFIY